MLPPHQYQLHNAAIMRFHPKLFMLFIASS